MKPVEHLAQVVSSVVRSLGVQRQPVSVTITFAFGPPVQLPLDLMPEPTAGEEVHAVGDATIQGQILDALAEAERPLKTSLIARRIGRSCNSYFRGVIKRMRDAGEIVLNAQGLYELPPDESADE
jgi:hypothetical protein